MADAGVQPIAVLPGPMRKMLGVDHAFVSPADFDGQVVGMQDSAESEETLVALGATTKALPGGANLSGVDGYEQQLASIVGNAYFNVASYVTANLNWWPRPLVVVANQESYDDLTDEQRDALATATERSFTAAMDASRAEDADAVGELCVEGMQLVEASADQLAALIQAVRPVHDRLEADAHSGPVARGDRAAQGRPRSASGHGGLRLAGTRGRRRGAPRRDVPDHAHQGSGAVRLPAG